MKVLFASPNPLDRKLGAPKVVMEVAESLRRLGCHCDLIGPTDLDFPLTLARLDPDRYALALRDYLRKHAAEYDVVDYDHEYLPFNRSEFPKPTLMVARSVLLHYHFSEIHVPRPLTLRSIAGRLTRKLTHIPKQMANRNRANRTAQQADLFVTLNSYDKKTLVRHGIASEKVAVVGLGLHPERFAALSRAAVERTPGSPPRIAFVGTFDYRKGCLDFPRIAQRINAALPGTKFRLLGTKAMFQNEQEVLAHFPIALRANIEVYPQFPPDELPELLKPCTAGIFPSYIEGFGFGVLEMLAAGLPVMAYDAPGPPDMLPERFLAPRGHWQTLADRLIELHRNPQLFQSESAFARDLAAGFTWQRAGERTIAVYSAAREKLLRGKSSEGLSEMEPLSREGTAHSATSVR